MGASETQSFHRPAETPDRSPDPSISSSPELSNDTASPRAAALTTKNNPTSFGTWASVSLATVAILGGAFVGRFSTKETSDERTRSDLRGEPTRDVEPVAVLSPIRTEGSNATPQSTVLLPTPGWRWVVPPTSVKELQSSEPATFIRLVFGESATNSPLTRSGDELAITVPHDASLSYRMVGIRPTGERIELTPRTRDSFSLGFTFSRYPDLVSIGFESANVAALNDASRRAIAEANARGLPTLPPARLGEELPFSLPTVDGQRITHETFKGKVVVLFEWATWCGACHRMMKDLFALTKADAESLELVAISHDAPRTAERAKKEMATFPPHTTNVGLFSFSADPNEAPKVSELWALGRKGVSGYGIPTVTVLGPDGKVLFDASSPDLGVLRETIARAVDETRSLKR